MRPLRAAQYVRMSTDHQQYSTANQMDVISAYARDRNITIVRSYADEGLSGLSIHWRDGLKALIADVESGAADFDCVLVYDVTRWGRFQNLDESAYYEFVCHRAGVTVHYCADEFENDGSLASFMIKNSKRAGAADFSRSLSKKVFLGQCRITRMGFWRGGMPSYGLRRQLLDDSGAVRATLEFKQRKYLQTDRVRIVHGPEHEVETVRRMFRWLVSEGKYFGDIAAELNAEHIRTTRGFRWNGMTVSKVLTNEAYTGSIIFNRASYKLKQRLVDNPPDMWIRHDHAFPPVISAELFAKAQEVIGSRRRKRSDQEMIDRLAALAREKGHLSTAIIDASEGMPTAETYRTRFGSLVTAYQLAGYQPEPIQRRAETATHYRSRIGGLAGELVAKINGLGGRATPDPDANGFRLNDDCRISVGSARAVKDGKKRVRWTVYADRRAAADLVLIGKMDAANDKIGPCYLLPAQDLMQIRARVIRMSLPIFAQACRYDSLDAFCRLCAGLDERAAA